MKFRPERSETEHRRAILDTVLIEPEAGVLRQYGAACGRCRGTYSS